MMDPETSESPVSSDSEPWEVQVWVSEQCLLLRVGEDQSSYVVTVLLRFSRLVQSHILPLIAISDHSKYSVLRSLRLAVVDYI